MSRISEVQGVRCPVCKKEKVRKSGVILQATGRYQRYQCVNPDCPSYGYQWKGEKVE